MKTFVDAMLLVGGLLLASAEHEGPMYLFSVNLLGLGLIGLLAWRTRDEGREL